MHILHTFPKFKNQDDDDTLLNTSGEGTIINKLSFGGKVSRFCTI